MADRGQVYVDKSNGDETDGIQKFSAVVRGRYTTVYKDNDIFIIENCTEDELKNIFIDYFDLNLDYDAVRNSLVQKLPILKDAHTSTLAGRKTCGVRICMKLAMTRCIAVTSPKSMVASKSLGQNPCQRPSM